MIMPWLCFCCRSMQHDCGHREPELVAWVRSMSNKKWVETARAYPAPAPGITPPARPATRKQLLDERMPWTPDYFDPGMIALERKKSA